MIAFDASSDTLQLRRVRLHGIQDGLRASLRFEAALAGLDWSSLSLPARALLIVKRLAPMVRLRLEWAGVAENFGQAVRVELERNARHARRPWDNPEAKNSEAVLFSDESELMACLLRDWLEGSLMSRWWWPVVLDGLSVPEWWRRNLLTRGDVLPAVLVHLAEQRQAVAWTVCLNEAEAAQAISATMAAHAVNSLPVSLSVEPLLPEVTPGLRQDQPTSIRSLAPPRDLRQDSLVAYHHLAAIVPESQSPALTISQRRLLALALGLQRASGWARSPAFVAALQAMEADYATTNAVSQDMHALRLDNSNTVDLAVRDLNDFSLAHGVGLADRSKLVIHSFEQLNKLSPESALGVREDPNKEESSLLSFHPNLLPDREGVGVLKSSASPSAVNPSNPSLASLPNTSQVLNQTIQGDLQSEDLPMHSDFSSEPELRSDHQPETQFRQAIETQYGGIFYLLNVALALEFYGDFTRPRAPDIALSPWDWLALIGRSWFEQDFENDALWPLLAELAGRSAQSDPGGDFLPPDSWIVSDDWLKPWEEPERAKVYVAGRRLQIWHDAAFVLIDAARIVGMPPLVQARQLCRKSQMLNSARLVRIYRQPQMFIPPISGGLALKRWLRWVLLYLHARLRRALGDDAPESLARLVCCQAAHIDCTVTAIDVHLTLAALPIQIRIAGLDRDPGWIPATGRSIAFHFE
ncbi:MAG: hypothetical protein ACXWT1_04525 [Methylobacter sp.]